MSNGQNCLQLEKAATHFVIILLALCIKGFDNELRMRIQAIIGQETIVHSQPIKMTVRWYPRDNKNDVLQVSP